MNGKSNQGNQLSQHQLDQKLSFGSLLGLVIGITLGVFFDKPGFGISTWITWTTFIGIVFAILFSKD